jgi:hypothetical protein
MSDAMGQSSVEAEETLPEEFLRKSPLFSFRLAVEGRELWAPREVLSVHSPVFQRMIFGGEWSEAQSGEARLADKKFDEVAELLRCIVPHPRLRGGVSDENVDLLLGFAEEYQLAELRGRCEDFLQRKLASIRAGELELLELLLLASKHRLGDLLRELLPKCLNFSLAELAMVKERLRPNVLPALYECMLHKWVDGDEAAAAEADSSPPGKKPHNWHHCCNFSGFGSLGGGSRNNHICSHCKAMFHCGHGVLCGHCTRHFCHACQPKAKQCRPSPRHHLSCRVCKASGPCDCPVQVDTSLLNAWG